MFGERVFGALAPSAVALVIGRLWALPCSAVGYVLAMGVWIFGGRLAWRHGVLEVVWRRHPGPWMRSLPWAAITLGEVIIAAAPRDLRRLRAHELVHVRQYRQWGPLFFLAYPLASAWQLLCGRRAYWDNPFEVSARRAEAWFE